MTQTAVSTLYDLGPDGATFDPPADLTLGYDPELLPADTDESNLALAVWNAETGKFDRIPGCAVDPGTRTVTGPVEHFSVFAVVAGTAPADIRMSDISVSPSQVAPGDKVVVSVQLLNRGDLPGNYSISLSVNDTVVDTRTLHLEGGATAAPEFSFSRLIEGTHTVDIGGLKTSFTVTKDPLPEPEPAPEPVPELDPDAAAPEPAAPPAAPDVPQPRNWTWLLGVIGGANVVVLILILLFTRRRA